MPSKQIDLGAGSIPINEFQLNSMAACPSIVMVAKRASGKSWICRSIVRHFKNIPVGMVIAPTDKMADPPFYSEFVPDTYIHYEYSNNVMKRLFARQMEMCEKEKKKKAEHKIIDPRAFLLMDDCLASGNSWKKDEWIKELFFNGRHFRIMYILTMQTPLGIPPEYRDNIDYVFLLYNDNTNNVKKLYEYYAGFFPSFDSFRQVFREVTKDYCAMVLNNRNGGSDDIREKVFWYKADNTSVGYVGCKQYNRYHRLNFNENWKAERLRMKFDIMDLGGKQKAQSKIRVSKITKEQMDEEEEDEEDDEN